MNEEERILLEEMAKLAKTNNKILKGMQRNARIAFFIHSLKWIAIVVAIFWSYALIQPYLVQIGEIYSGVKSAQDSIGNIQGQINFDSSQIGDFFKSFGSN